MKCGTIDCQCGQRFYFESSNEGVYRTIGFDDNREPINKFNPPTIICIQCSKDHDISTYPEKLEEPIEEVGGRNGTDI